MRFLTLDQSGFCGFCHGEAGDRPGANHTPIYGTHRLPKNMPMSGRLIALVTWQRDMLVANGIEKVFFEKPIMPMRRDKDPATGKVKVLPPDFKVCMSLFGIASAVAMACAWENVPCFPIDMQTWRSEFGVPTQAPKEIPQRDRRQWVKDQTMARCRALGFEPEDDNAGDAIGIWWAMSERILAKEASPQFDFTTKRIEI